MKNIIRLLSITLILVISLSSVACASYEEDFTPYTNAYIESMTGALSKSGDTLYVTFTVQGTRSMTSIGASCVKIYTSGGTLEKTFWSAYNPSMLGSNTYTYTSTLSYDDGVDGTTYYAVITGYASYGGGSGTETYTTASLKL